MTTELVDDRYEVGRVSTADVVEDVAELLAGGVSAEEVCSRLGRSAAGLEKRMDRAGRPDLRLPFASLSSRIYYGRGTKR